MVERSFKVGALDAQNFYLRSNGYLTTLLANPALNANLTFSLPSTTGSTGQVLTSDGSGNLFFSDVSVLGSNSNLTSDQYTITSINSFSLSQSVQNANNILVTLDGIVQDPNDDYVVIGSTLSFNNTEPLASGVELEVRYLNTTLSDIGGGGGGGDSSNAWVNANDFITYTTLTANDYATYTSLKGMIDTVQDNVSSGGGGGGSSFSSSNAILFSDTFNIDGSSNSFTLTSNVTTGAYLLVYIDGLLQHDDAYTIDGNLLTLSNTTPLSPSKLGVRALAGTQTSSSNNLIDVLIVAGGGAGEGSVTSDSSGGGGAGGLIYLQNLAISTGTEYSIFVGAGGTGAAKNSSTSGSNSTAFGLTAIGGGKGGVWGAAGSPGGSGGGGAGRALDTTFNYGGSGITNQGHFGGNAVRGTGSTADAGGGGGGAGGPGHSAREFFGGEGGVGLAIDIEGNPYTTYYAGGGGGGSEAGDSTAPGGRGGGGYGGSVSAGDTAGEANTGGGGGGSGSQTTNNGGSGGSGVVIIRTLLTAVATTGSPTTNTSNSYNIYKFTGSGSITF